MTYQPFEFLGPQPNVTWTQGSGATRFRTTGISYAI